MNKRFTDVRTRPYAPPQEHIDLQRDEPVARLDWEARAREVWTVTKYEDVRSVLSDTRFSSDRSRPEHPSHLAYHPDSHPGRIIEMDPPEHSTQRGRVMNEFTVKKIRNLRPRIEEIVTECIDGMLASNPRSGDLVQLLSLPVPSMVIADMLGVADEDHEFFQTNTAAFAEGGKDPGAQQRANVAIIEFITKLVDQRIANPGDDIISRQLEAGAPRAEAIGLGHLLLIAGHETTSNMISLCIMTLLDQPALLAQLQEDPKLIPKAVEELLRYFTIAEVGHTRVAVEDIEVAGVTIPAGSTVYALTNVANRDPEVFAAPDVIDFNRGARNHMAFGFGPHQCLGQNVARLELEVVLEQVLARLPDLRLDVPIDELKFKKVGNFGISALPVSW